MQITGNLGQEIIKRVSKYTEYSINIMNLEGTIVASTDPSRIGEVHSGALEVLKSEKELIINEERLADYPGTKLGVNLPIQHNKKLAGVVGVSGRPEEIYKITGLIQASVELMMDQIQIERLEFFKERQWGYFMQQLLHPSGFDKESLEEEAEYSLQVDIHRNFKVLVLSSKQSVDKSLLDIRREIKSMKMEVLCTIPFTEDEVIIVLPASSVRLDMLIRTLLHITSKHCRIGIGEKGFGLKGIRNSYQLAKQALFFAGKDKRISDSSDWQLERLIAAMDEEEYKGVSFEYARILDHLDPIYVETIDTFFDRNLSIKKTAEALHIHRNTLLYRLDQIHHKVGLDPRNFYDACILKIIRGRQICANAQE